MLGKLLSGLGVHVVECNQLALIISDIVDVIRNLMAPITGRFLQCSHFFIQVRAPDGAFFLVSMTWT
jgi:hypothetical protein